MNGRLTLSVLIVTLLLPAAGASAQDVSYTIHDGETLFAIAQKLGIPLEILSAYNGIKDAGHVKAGTSIRLPRAYSVKKGDTLFAISKKYSVTLSELLAFNALHETSVIKAGEKLFIPGPNDQSIRVEADSGQGGNPPAGSAKTAAIGGGSDSGAKADVVWPHPGKREPYQGKIPGLVFHGSLGDKVVSAGDGEVVWVAPYWGYGKVVIIENFEDGLVFTYAGNEELLVNVGDRVKPGSEIAKLGQSPKDGEARLYFSIRTRNGQVVSPEKYFSRG